MTNVDRILALIRTRPGLTDAELGRRSGVAPHQQVNQICRGLAQRGLIRRERGRGGLIVNVAVQGGTSAPATARVPPSPIPGPAGQRAHAPPHRIRDGRTLLVIQCSGAKAPGGSLNREGPSVLDLLPAPLAERLRNARRTVAPLAALDERLWRPAWKRYTGRFYVAAAERLSGALQNDFPVVIVSGGYGLLLPSEPIGTYRRRLSLGDWPRGLLEDCLLALASELKVREVTAFCSASTDYAKLMRRTTWSTAGIPAHIGTPEPQGRGGSQILVPRAAGEAFRAFLDGRLTDRWQSSDGLPVTWEERS